ncbi:MAG: MoaD/ThiS family protein [Leptolyngbya sp.]|nr:MoaD/ThiS family protein [Candidatus Melainabacteria bacterium]
MLVHIPSPLRHYTGGVSQVDAQGSSVSELLNDLDNKYSGIKFRMIDEHDRMRQHIKIFVNKNAVNSVAAPLSANDEVHIICALSGG